MRLTNLSFFLLVLLFSAAAWADEAATSSEIIAVEAGIDGTLWVLSEGELHLVGGGKSQSLPLPGEAQEAESLSLATSVDGDLYIAGEDVGIYRSTDKGQSWEKVSSESVDSGINAVVTHSTLDDTVYANRSGGGIFRSEDGGSKWERVDAGPQEPVRAFLHSNMEGSMQTGWLFAATERGIARSMDCFCFWGDAGELRGQASALAYDHDSPMNVYAAVDGTLYHSADGGESWSALPAVPGSINDLAFTKGALYAATEKGLFALNGSGQWERAGA